MLNQKLWVAIVWGVLATTSFAQADLTQEVNQDLFFSYLNSNSQDRYEKAFAALGVHKAPTMLSSDEQNQLRPAANILWNREYELRRLPKIIKTLEAQRPQDSAKIEKDLKELKNQPALIAKAKDIYNGRVDDVSMERSAAAFANMPSTSPHVTTCSDIQSSDKKSDSASISATDSVSSLAGDTAKIVQQSAIVQQVKDEHSKDWNEGASKLPSYKEAIQADVGKLSTVSAPLLGQEASAKISLPAHVTSPISSFKAPSCALPSGGEKSYVTQFTGMHYMLKRDDDSADGHPVFEAVLNLHFVSNREDAHSPDSPYTDEMEKRADDCYAALGPIQGPNGETLKIRRASDEERSQVQENIVEITPTMREDDMDWMKDADCTTIIHESFHHLGLVDTYSEVADTGSQKKQVSLADGTKANQWDCRSDGPKDSVMAFQDIAAGETYGYYGKLSCACEQEGFRQCSKALDDLRSVPDACPAESFQSAGSIEAFPGSYNGRSFDLNRLNLANSDSPANYVLNDAKKEGMMSGSRPSPDQYHGMKWVAPTRKSILYPGEFRMIAYPDCQTENTVYRGCAANAYRTSEVEGCLTAPAECSNADEWLK